MNDGWKVLGIIAVIIGVVIAIIFAAKEQDKWEAWCKDQGGHVAHHTSTHTITTYDNQGTPHFGTSSDTTYYCLSASGTILDIR